MSNWPAFFCGPLSSMQLASRLDAPFYIRRVLTEVTVREAALWPSFYCGLAADQLRRGCGCSREFAKLFLYLGRESDWWCGRSVAVLVSTVCVSWSNACCCCFCFFLLCEYIACMVRRECHNDKNGCTLFFCVALGVSFSSGFF